MESSSNDAGKFEDYLADAVASFIADKIKSMPDEKMELMMYQFDVAKATYESVQKAAKTQEDAITMHQSVLGAYSTIYFSNLSEILDKEDYGQALDNLITKLTLAAAVSEPKE